MNDIVDVDEIAGKGRKDVKQAPNVDAKGSTVSDEGSGRSPAQVPNGVPTPQTGGKYIPSALPPGTLEWGCTPNVLFN